MQLELAFDRPDDSAARDLRARVDELTASLLARARERWPDARIPEIRNDFSLRGHTAGEALAESWTARYNVNLLERYGDEFLRDIVPHEVAHLVVAAVWGDRVKPHGSEWRDVMAFFGADDSVTHSFRTRPARRGPRVSYRCRCGEPHFLTPRAHRRIRRGSVEYRCTECGELLVYVA